MQEFEHWQERHAAAFGMTSAADAALFLVWEEVFDRCGYELFELLEATEWIAAHPPLPVGRASNLDAIHTRIRERRRQERLARDRESETESKSCPDCQTTGWVQVPHLRSVANGEWFPPYYASAVICPCPRGQAVVSSWTGPSKREDIAQTMGLAQYETLNPTWREQVAAKRRLDQAKREARKAARAADRKRPGDE